MPVARLGAAALSVLLLTSAVACGGATRHQAGRHPANATGKSATPTAPTTTGQRPADPAGAGADVAANGRTVGVDTQSRAALDRQAAARNSGHRAGLRGDAPYVWSIHATVAPTCVQAGSAAHLTVHTAPNAAVAYVAMYAGNKSGAVPPFGDGYGGNSEGYSSRTDGVWTDTWTVRADAPRGPAHVTVVVASHQTTKQVDVPFTVVDPLTGTC
jgi:hypothetical protein